MTEAGDTGQADSDRDHGGYRGRFAPSPTGPLHQGSLISALASHLDARVHGGEWLVRIEDVDGPRAVAGMAEDILATLTAYGMRSDRPVVWQSSRSDAYEAAFAQLVADGYIYPCGCSRREIADSLIRVHAGHQRNATLAYPGTCRNGLQGRSARAWRIRVSHGSPDSPDSPDSPGAEPIAFTDRWMGRQSQDLESEIGDFALKRADGLWAYQLAVVVDDAAAGITDIVRGADLLDSTPRQIYLQHCLKLPTPRYLHVPVLLNATGEKYSKQNGAPALPRAPAAVLTSLIDAAAFLELSVRANTIDEFHAQAQAAWKDRLNALPET